MQQENRWPETRDALLEIAEHALQQDSDQIDMRFLNSPLMYRGIKVLLDPPLVTSLANLSISQGSDTIMSIFDQVQPRGLFNLVESKQTLKPCLLQAAPRQELRLKKCSTIT
jgi:hypothetical protein